MKTSVALVLALGVLVPAFAAEPKAGPADPKAKVAIPAPAPVAKDAKAPGAPAKKDAKKEEEMGKIEGFEIPRGKDRFLGLELVDGKFKLSFYNAKKKPVAPDVSRAIARWDPKYKLGVERSVLNPSGKALVGDKFIRPPYNFNLTIVLLRDDAPAPTPGPDGTIAEPAGETFVIPFRQ
jgi:hypothetical protein